MPINDEYLHPNSDFGYRQTRVRPATPETLVLESKPLPRNTVAKNWSSSSPKRLRGTPMNHRNAMPRNKVEREPYRASAARLGEPFVSKLQIRRDGIPDESQTDDHQD